MSDEEEAMSANERTTRVGFALGRVVWFGGPNAWREDCLFYFETEHTLASICRGHALHPFERFDRVVYLLCVLCFSLFMSAYIQNVHPQSESVSMYWAFVTLSAILLVVYDFMLRFLATSPCMQPGGSLYSTCWLCRDCCVDMGRQGLYLCAVCSTGFLVAGVVLATTSEADPAQFFATFVIMKLSSYVAELGPLAYFFHTAREAQRVHWAGGVAGGAYPLGPTCPEPLFVRESRLHGVKRYWPGAPREARNPLYPGHPIDSGDHTTRDSSDVARANAVAAVRRERQVEMLQMARDKVRQSDARRAGPDAAPKQGRDVLESFGDRL